MPNTRNLKRRKVLEKKNHRQVNTAKRKPWNVKSLFHKRSINFHGFPSVENRLINGWRFFRYCDAKLKIHCTQNIMNWWEKWDHTVLDTRKNEVCHSSTFSIGPMHTRATKKSNSDLAKKNKTILIRVQKTNIVSQKVSND